MQKNLKKWIVISYGSTAFIALCLVLSVFVFREESSNGFEKALNSLFDVIFQIMIVFFYLVFVFSSAAIAMIYGYYKQKASVISAFKPYLIFSLIGIVILMIISQL